MNRRLSRLCVCFVLLLVVWTVYEAVHTFLQIPAFEDGPNDPDYLKQFDEPPEVLQNQIVYVITPTYSRLTQKADLVSLRSTLSNLDFIHWIIVEDSAEKTPLVTRFLEETSVPYTHLAVPSPRFITAIIRGSNQRNMGLDWLRKNKKPGRDSGVVYFADDDNTYDPRIFKEMRTTKRGSTWPVGLVGGISWEGCVTSSDDRSKIVEFWALFRRTRAFPLDMAAFAINLKLLFLYPDAKFSYSSAGEQEGLILAQLGFKSAFDLEPKASGCTKASLNNIQSFHYDC
nr:unnamed protein product [Spirometra erinaceieuropaei]